MHIYTVKASSIKFFAVVFLSVAALVMLAAFVPSYSAVSGEALAALKYTGIETNDERIEFLKQLGYTTLPEPSEVVEIVIPEKFDSVYEMYNNIQRSQGLDLTRYKGKKAVRYTYSITDYEGYPNAIANIIIYKDKIIGGDVCSVGENGFIHGFAKEGTAKEST